MRLIDDLKKTVLDVIPADMQDLAASNEKVMQGRTPVAWNAPSHEQLYYYFLPTLINSLDNIKQLPQLLVDLLALNKEFVSKDAKFNQVKADLLIEVGKALVQSHTELEMQAILKAYSKGFLYVDEFRKEMLTLLEARQGWEKEEKLKRLIEHTPEEDENYVLVQVQKQRLEASHYASQDVDMAYQNLLHLMPKEEPAAIPQLSFLAYKDGFAKRYPHSYFGFIGKSPLETALNLLTDYTKGDSRFKRVAFFHWNRHHVELVSRTIKATPASVYGDEKQIFADLLKKFMGVPMNLKGSLRARLNFIAEQAEYVNYTDFCSKTRYPRGQQATAAAPASLIQM